MLTLLCQSGLSAAGAGILNEQISFMELALANKSLDELDVLIGNFHPEEYEIDQTAVTAYSDRLVALSMSLLDKGRQNTALSLLSKSLVLDPEEWRAFSLIHHHRPDRSFFSLDFLQAFSSQIGRLLRKFETAVILTTQILEAMFWAVILTILAFVVWLIRQYLPLATVDMIMDDRGLVDKKKLAVWCLLLLWPVLFGSGWLLLVFIVIASLWLYTDADERKTLRVLFIILALMTVLSSLNLFLVQQMNHPDFVQSKEIIETGHTRFSRQELGQNSQARLFLAYNNFRDGHLEEGITWLNEAEDSGQHELKGNLYGYAFLSNKEYDRAISFFSTVLSKNPLNETAVYNLTLALLEKKEEAVLDAYMNRFPQITSYRDRVTQPRLPPITSRFLWELYLGSGKKIEESASFFLVKSVLHKLILFPVLYYFIVFFIYIRFLPEMFRHLGRSTHCTKCQKAIKKDNSNKAVNVCNDCYQLFMIKDAILVDAKSFKEAEINRLNKKKNVLLLLLSFVSPGFFLHMRGQHLLFSIINFFYFLFILLAVLVWQPLAAFHGITPLFAKASGFLAALLFLFGNAMVFKGDEYGV
jgi:tetratricopeptide (TPR) repeat protein